MPLNIKDYILPLKPANPNEPVWTVTRKPDRAFEAAGGKAADKSQGKSEGKSRGKSVRARLKARVKARVTGANEGN
jgi:hypothetical protein